jgi:hypothetical protein
MNEDLIQHVLLNAVLASSTDTVNWEPTVSIESRDVKQDAITQFLIRQTAINVMHREDLNCMSRLCDQYIEDLSQVIRVKEDILSPLVVVSPTDPKASTGKRSIDTKQISQVKKELQKAYQQDALEQAKRRKKRKGYSKDVSEVLNSWYHTHLDSPYPYVRQFIGD